MKVKTIILSFFLVNSAVGSVISISAKTSQDKKYQSIYTIKNSSEMNYYCRNIYLKDIDYLSAGEYVYSLDDKIENKFLKPQHSVVVPQRPSQDLVDLLDVFPDLSASHDRMAYAHDCDTANVRMNNIFVLDDSSQCGGGVELKQYALDNGNNILLPVENIEVPFSKDSKFIKLNLLDSMLVFDRGSFQLFNVITKKVEALNFEIGNEIFISAFNLTQQKFVIVSYNRDGIVFNLIDNGHFSEKLQTSIASLKLNMSNEENIVNEEEAQMKLYRQYEKVAKTISVYVKSSISFESLEIIVSSRLPDLKSYPTSFSYSENRFTKSKFIVGDALSSLSVGFSKYVLGFGEEFKIIKNIVIDTPSIESEIFGKFFLKVAPAERILNYGDYTISARGKALKISSDAGQSSRSELCHPLSVFSDKRSLYKNENINDLYQGKTLLSMRTRSGNYKEVLKLINHGARVDEKDILGKTPVDYAIFNRDLKMVRLLVENGARFSNSKSFDINTVFENSFDDYDYQEDDERAKNISFFSYIAKVAFVNEAITLTPEDKKALIEKIDHIAGPLKEIKGML